MADRRAIFDEEFLRRLQRLHLIAKRLADRGPAGPQRSRRVGDGLEFADHRAYADGDDVRFIDWPYYARMEKLLLRMFHQHSDCPVVILLDASGSMAPGGAMAKFDYACHAAAALAYVAVASLRRVVLQPFAQDLLRPLQTGRNRDQIFQVLDFLSALRPDGPTRFLHCAQRLWGQMEAGSIVVLLSDLLEMEEELSAGLARLLHKGGDVIVLQVHTSAEAGPQLAGPLLMEAAEAPQRMALHADEPVLAEYRRQWRLFQESCQKACLARGATYVCTSTDLPFEKLILQTLRQAGVLAG